MRVSFLPIVLPLTAPGVAATAIFAFVSSWSELLFAITFTTQSDMRTLSAGLLYMEGRGGRDPHALRPDGRPGP